MGYALPDLRYQKALAALDAEALVKHLESFRLEPRFSVGVWYFTPSGGRFHAPYVEPASIEARLETAARLAPLGVTGIEAHYPTEINRENLHLYRALERTAGVRLVAVALAHFFAREFEFGALSSPYARVRERALAITVEALELVRDTGAACAISWPGIDGYTYPLGTVFPWMWRNFEETLAAAMDAVPGVRVALEPKPYEPAPNNIYRTTAEGILAAQRIEARLGHPTNRARLAEGHALVGLNPEIGHVRMGFEDAAAAYALVGMEGRLAHVHLNSQPLGNYDQDLNVGVVEWQQAEAMLYALKMMGYREGFGIDIHPERMPVETAVELNIRAVRLMNERLERIPHGRLLACFLDPAAHRGGVESILLELMARG
ncbi:MAG: xylose isomerase [Planctomycetes bacterium]|nr:xylose isomerase [Planctomycetota bacterium]